MNKTLLLVPAFSMAVCFLIVCQSKAAEVAICNSIFVHKGAINEFESAKKSQSTGLINIEKHQLVISISGNPIQSVTIFDKTSKIPTKVFFISYRRDSRGDLVVQNVEHLFNFERQLSHDQIPAGERVSFGMLKPIIKEFEENQELQNEFGYINGATMTNQHRSIVLYATADGTWHLDQDGPVRLLVIDKKNHSIKRIVEYQLSQSDNQRLVYQVGLDISRIVVEYASFLDLSDQG